jgi:hypothetical protein
MKYSMPVLKGQYICVRAGSIVGILQTRHQYTYKLKNKEIQIYRFFYTGVKFGIILGEEMYKDTHEQGAEGNTWIQEADTDRKTNKTA